MTTQQKSFFWLGGFIVFLLLIFLLRDVLLPFVVGMAVAYFLDPVCDWLESHGVSRTMATSIVTAIFFVIFVLALSFLLPAAFREFEAFIRKIPAYLDALEQKATPLVILLREYLNGLDFNLLSDKAAGVTADIFKGVGRLTQRVVSGVGTVVNLLSLILLTPIVTFYLLRDWDLIVAKVDSWLPLQHAETIRGIAREVDRTLSGFVRGQISVCVLLGLVYAIGLTAVGLDFGLVIGFLTGVISFIPYFGMLLGFAVGLGVAVAQFSELLPIGLVALVFGAGQILEGYFLTPKLIGGRVGLHPVWIIFALMAGGALFGFLGVLLAVPLMAVIGVLIRFFLKQYLGSPLYDPSVKSKALKAGSHDDSTTTSS